MIAIFNFLVGGRNPAFKKHMKWYCFEDDDQNPYGSIGFWKWWSESLWIYMVFEDHDQNPFMKTYAFGASWSNTLCFYIVFGKSLQILFDHGWYYSCNWSGNRRSRFWMVRGSCSFCQQVSAEVCCFAFLVGRSFSITSEWIGIFSGSGEVLERVGYEKRSEADASRLAKTRFGQSLV